MTVDSKAGHKAPPLTTEELRKRLYSRYAGSPDEAWLIEAGDKLKELERELQVARTVMCAPCSLRYKTWPRIGGQVLG